jgi:hypothetical protein
VGPCALTSDRQPPIAFSESGSLSQSGLFI